MSIKERISNLRAAMKEAGVAAWIVPGTDPHMNEYLPKHWTERAFISGFTGSAGKVVITQNMAGLWTDGRYFLQAEKQLAEGGLILFKEGIEGTPSICEYLCATLDEGDKIGVNGLIISENQKLEYERIFSENRIIIVTELDLLSPIWDNRPELSKEPLFTLHETISGESTAHKLTRLRESMVYADAVFINALDEIAWLFNLRGTDIKCNPVVMSYAWVEKDFAVLFVDEDKVLDEEQAVFEYFGIHILPYEFAFEALAQLSQGKVVRTDFNKTNHAAIAAMAEAKLIDTPSWIALAKAQKNKIELDGTRRAMKKDGVALTQFFIWLEDSVANNNLLSEYEIGQRVAEFRAQQDDYMGESFDPIVGYNANAAIIHYSAKENSCADVIAEGSLLLDLGAQFKHGTTDITRTIALGEVSDELKHDFTLVLKGHINIATAKFPKGTRGTQLDALARIALWNEGKDYQHGTGHGVGHFLNVHEGPQNIRKNENNTNLLPGMIISNEPGYYLEGKYGIRVENLVVVQPFNDDFYQFETLTLFPIDKNLIDINLLSQKEISWINDYHTLVYDRLYPLLNKDEKTWLKTKTLAI